MGDQVRLTGLPENFVTRGGASVESQPWRHYVRTSPYRLEVAAPSGRNPWQCDCSPVSDVWRVRTRCVCASVGCRSWGRLLVLYNMWPDLGNALDEHGAGGVPSQMPRLSARRTLRRRRSCLGPPFHLCCVRPALDAAGSLRADRIAQGTIDDRVPVDRSVRRAAHCDGHRLELFHPADASIFPREWSPLRRLWAIAATPSSCSRASC